MKSSLNIFITAIGSMSADACIAALNAQGIKPFVGDIYPENYHLHISSHNVKGFFQLPKAFHQFYSETLLEICKKNSITHVFPLTDLEIDVLNQNRALFDAEGIVLCMSGSETIPVVRNKKTIYDLLKNDSMVSAIPTFLWEERNKLNGIVIAKPACGRSSERTFILNDCEHLQYLTDNCEDYILQPYLQGDVITCDFVRDTTGNSEYCIRKELLRTKNGAGTTVEMIENQKLGNILNYLGSFFNIQGCINIEFLQTENEAYIMDINPRFSAGVGFSVKAGCDMIINHLRCFIGESIVKNQQPFKPQIFSKRFVELPL